MRRAALALFVTLILVQQASAGIGRAVVGQLLRRVSGPRPHRPTTMSVPRQPEHRRKGGGGGRGTKPPTPKQP